VATEVTTTYTNNGQVQTVADAINNLTTYVYDGHDRPSQTQYPSASQGAGTSNSSDYEQFSYDAASNVTSRRLRDTASIGYSYDNLNRPTHIDRPGTATWESDQDLVYDLLGHPTQTSDIWFTQNFGYDALGRLVSDGDGYNTRTMGYDLAGRRTSLDYGNSLVIGYTFDAAGEMIEVRENPAGSNVLLATYAYDDRGRRTSLTRGNGAVTSYGYDGADRLTSLAHDLSGTSYDLTLGDSYNPAGGIVSHTSSNDAYAWAGHYAVTRGYTTNGRNQYTATGSITPTYDARGNLTSAGSMSYSYTVDNRMTAATGYTMAYYPTGQLATVSYHDAYQYDGANLITERDWNTAAIVRRYVHGAGGEPLAWYEGSGTSTRRYFHGDERGSIVAVSDGSGAMYAVNTYDEHGIPGASNSGRFQYTGQAWMAEIGMYYYRARIYSPTLGRFLQTDPIGFGGGMNLYAYVSGDPVNATDPAGTCGPGDRAPTSEELAACQASQSAFYANYHPMDYLGGNEMAAYMQGQMFNAVIGGGGGYWLPGHHEPGIPTGAYAGYDNEGRIPVTASTIWIGGTYLSLGGMPGGIFQNAGGGNVPPPARPSPARPGPHQTPPPSPRSPPPPPEQDPRCHQYVQVGEGLAASAAMNEGGALVTGEVTPVAAIFHTIAVVEGLGAVGLIVYGDVFCR
jgi:RHS repeat-associated protein